MLEWLLWERNAEPGYLEGCAFFDFESGDISQWAHKGKLIPTRGFEFFVRSWKKLEKTSLF